MPSRPSLQAWAKMVGPSPSKCSLKRRASFGQHTSKRGLAHFQRIAPQVVTLQFDQVECVDEDTVVVAVVGDEIEQSNARGIPSDSLALHNAGARAQAGERINDQREAAGEVIAGTAVEPHLRAVLAGNDAEAVMLDLMQPLAAGRQLIGFGWKARRDEAGREGAHTQHNAHS